MGKYDLHNSIYKNAEMGITTLEQIIPRVQNHNMRNILINQYNGYKTQKEAALSSLKSQNTPTDAPKLSQMLMAKAEISMKLRHDNSSENIARMLINGTNSGIIKLCSELNHSGECAPEAQNSVKNCIRCEEKYADSLKSFL